MSLLITTTFLISFIFAWGRRMRGEYVMTEHDIRLLRVKYDSIGMGSNYIEATPRSASSERIRSR